MYNSHDYIGDLLKNQYAVKSFAKFNPVAYQRMGNEIMEYARYVRQVTDGIHWERKDLKGINPEPVVQYGAGGLPLFPEKQVGVSGKETVTSLVDVTRAFINAHYRMLPFEGFSYILI